MKIQQQLKRMGVGAPKNDDQGSWNVISLSNIKLTKIEFEFCYSDTNSSFQFSQVKKKLYLS